MTPGLLPCPFKESSRLKPFCTLTLTVHRGLSQRLKDMWGCYALDAKGEFSSLPLSQTLDLKKMFGLRKCYVTKMLFMLMYILFLSKCIFRCFLELMSNVVNIDRYKSIILWDPQYFFRSIKGSWDNNCEICCCIQIFGPDFFIWGKFLDFKSRTRQGTNDFPPYSWGSIGLRDYG